MVLAAIARSSGYSLMQIVGLPQAALAVARRPSNSGEHHERTEYQHYGSGQTGAC
jgi:hypothetical protein